VAFLASFLIVLGLLQLVSVYLGLRGASLTGWLNGPGILVGIALFTAGVWLAIDTPAGLLLLYAIPGIVLAALVLALVGVVWNLGWSPAQHFLDTAPDKGWHVEEVRIPMQLSHVAQGVQLGDDFVPATYLHPDSTCADPESIQDGKAVLLICGAGDCRMAFKWQLFEALLAQGIAVLTIDPPGHGDFAHAPMTLANARAANRAALSWLYSRPGVKQVAVCGISFGGNQAAALAAEDQRVRALALISTPVTLNLLSRKTYVAEFLNLFIWPRNLGLLREGSLLTLWREWRSMKGAWFAESLYDMIRQFDTPATLRALGARPKLIAHGTCDVAIPVSNARSLYEAAGPECELMLIRQATHISPVLYRPEMQRLAVWFAHSFAGSLNYNPSDARQTLQS
jgi:pimeloyl-ACP methyl ester carboxylesterase